MTKNRSKKTAEPDWPVLERWNEIADHHLVISDFLKWLEKQTGTKVDALLLYKYFEIDVSELERARQAAAESLQTSMTNPDDGPAKPRRRHGKA